MKKAVNAITLILIGSILVTYRDTNNSWNCIALGIIGLILYLVGLSQFKPYLEGYGKKGVQLLTISSIIYIIANVLYTSLHAIPFLGIIFSIISSVFLLIAFILQIMGMLQLKKSPTIGAVGSGGINLILAAIAITICGAILGVGTSYILPVVGGMILSVISYVALLFVLFGWLKVQQGIIESTKRFN